MRKEFDVSEEWKGQCDQDVMSEQASKWRVGRDVARVRGRARPWDPAGSHDIGVPTIARPWVRSRDERCKIPQGDPGLIGGKTQAKAHHLECWAQRHHCVFPIL